MMENVYLQEAFKALDILNEEDFNLTSTDGFEDAKDFIDKDEKSDFIDVIDPEAETEEELKDSYVGDVILDCCVCHSKLYKHPEEVHLDEEEGLANMDEECPFCYSTDGYTIIGQVAPFEEEEEEKVEIDDEVEVDDGVNESFKRKRKLKEEFDESIWYKLPLAVQDRLDSYWNADANNKVFKPYLTALADIGVLTSDEVTILLKSNIEDGYATTMDESFKRTRKLKEAKTPYADKKRIMVIGDHQYPAGSWSNIDDNFYDYTIPKALDKLWGIADSDYWTDRTLPYEEWHCFANMNDSDPEDLSKIDSEFIQDLDNLYQFIGKCKSMVDDGYTDYIIIEDDDGNILLEYGTNKYFNKTSEEVEEGILGTGIGAAGGAALGGAALGPLGALGGAALGGLAGNALTNNNLTEDDDYDYDDYDDWDDDYYDDDDADYDMDKMDYKTVFTYLSKCLPKGVSIDDIDINKGKGYKTFLIYLTPEKYNNDGYGYEIDYVPKETSPTDFLDYVEKSLNHFINKVDGIDESLSSLKSRKRSKKIKEHFEKVEIETDKEKMEMTTEENGKVVVTTEPKNNEEVIVPVSDDVQTEINDVVEIEDEPVEEEPIEDGDYEDIDVDEFSEEEFDDLGESYLKKVYENVKSFKTSNVKTAGNKLVVEGIIGFTSGKNKKTSFIFESKDINKKGKVRFIGENLQLSRGKKAFTITGSINKGKFIAESLNYNYRAKDSDGKSTRLYGTVRTKK